MPGSAGEVRGRYNTGMDKYLHQVAGLSDPTRSALEALLGRSLANDEQVYVVAVNPAAEKPAEVRREAWQRSKRS